jgi:hypothetical protein
MQCGCFTTYVLTNDANLFGGDVQLVSTFLGYEQIITFHATNAAFHHAFVFAYSVMGMHHITTWLQVFKCGGAVSSARSGGSSGATATTEI